MLYKNHTGINTETCPSDETVLIVIWSVGCVGYLCLGATIAFWCLYVKCQCLRRKLKLFKRRDLNKQKRISTIYEVDKRYVKDPTAHQVTESSDRQTNQDYDYAYGDCPNSATNDYENTMKETTSDTNRLSTTESLYENPEKINQKDQHLNEASTTSKSQNRDQNRPKITATSSIPKTDRRQIAKKKRKNPKTSFHLENEQEKSKRNVKTEKGKQQTGFSHDNTKDYENASTVFKAQDKMELDRENVTRESEIYENVDHKHEARKSASSTDTCVSTDSASTENSGTINMRGNINVLNYNKTVYYPNACMQSNLL